MTFSDLAFTNYRAMAREQLEMGRELKSHGLTALAKRRVTNARILKGLSFQFKRKETALKAA